MASQKELNAMRVRVRRRTRTARQPQAEGGVDHNLLLQELQRNLLASPDFRQVVDQLEQRLLRNLTQQLAVRPLQQIGTDLGSGVRDVLFGASEEFAPSTAQTGALLSRLLERAEGIL
ncbi:MAG: hypothetical protein WBK91_05510 [Alphaproteobacteria bacterium]